MRKEFLKGSRGILNIFIGVIIAGLISAQCPLLCFAEEAAEEISPPQQEPSPPSEKSDTASQPAAEEKFISMDFQDAPLKQILKIFSQQAGMNFVAAETIQDKKVTLFLEKVSVQDALNSILGANGLAFEKQEGTNIFMVKDMGGPPIALQTRIFKLSYAAVAGAQAGEEAAGTGIENVIKEMLSVNGKLIVDSRTNTLLVTDVPFVLIKIEEVLKELDVKTSQVLISAEILEVSVDTLKRLGVEWGSSTGQFLTYTGGSRSTFWPFKEGLFKGATQTDTLGSVSFASFTGVLQAIKTDAATQYLARPRLLTLNNRAAEMKITRNAAVASTTVTVSQGGSPQTTTSLERYEVGTTLKVTPHINKDDYITMTIEPSVSRVKEASFGSGYYDPLTRSSKTTIMIKDGETVVIAGLLSREDSDSNRKVPLLGEVPLFGAVFTRDTKQRSDTEILIFITPRIIKEEGVALAAAMQEELGLAGIGELGREGELARGKRPVTAEKRPGREGKVGFRLLTREQDSPLSGRELIMEAELLKLKSMNKPVAD